MLRSHKPIAARISKEGAVRIGPAPSFASQSFPHSLKERIMHMSKPLPGYPAAHTWATIKPSLYVPLPPLTAMPKYDSGYFGIDQPRPAFDVAKRMRDRRMPDGTLKKGFETKERAADEDRLRAEHLTLHGGKRGKELANHLLDAIRSETVYPSMASARWFRKFRQRLIGEILAPLDPYSDQEIRFVTLINRKWKFPVGTLRRDVNPMEIMESFRQHLNRAGVTAAEGKLFAWLHGEHDSTANVYRLHVHAIVVGDKIAALDNLKSTKENKNRWGYEKVPGDTARPVVFNKIEDRVRQVSYTFQSWWPSRARYYNHMKDSYWKTTDRVRPRDAVHAEILMWLAYHRPSEFFLSQPNIRIKRNRDSS